MKETYEEKLKLLCGTMAVLGLMLSAEPRMADIGITFDSTIPVLGGLMVIMILWTK